MKEGSIPAALRYRIQYKVMNTCNSRVLLKTNDRETTLFVTDMTKANVAVPKLIKWDEVELPTSWQLERATPTLHRQTPELQEIRQSESGKVEIIFDRIMIQSEFQIDKEALRKEFSLEENQPQRSWFLKNYQGFKRTEIQEIYYNFLNSVKLNIPFLDWFHAYTIKKNIDYPFKHDLIGHSTNVVIVWHLKDGEKIQSELPPKTQYQLPQIRDDKNNFVLAAPFKTKDVDENLTSKDIKSIMEQVNYTNKYLQILGDKLAVQKFESSQPPSIQPTSSKHLEKPLFQPFKLSQKTKHTLQKAKAKANIDFDASELLNKINNLLKATTTPDTPQVTEEASSRPKMRIATRTIDWDASTVSPDLSLKALSHTGLGGDFKWYKDTFLTRVFTREDSPQPFWKENFLAGLPRSLGNKVRDKIRALTPDNIIPYDHLICYNCKKPGHISKYCRLKRKISNLNLELELEEQISSLLVETSEEDLTDDYSGEDIHNVQQDDDVSSSDSIDTPNINVLTKEQDLLFEAINSIPDKLKQTLEKRPSNLVITNKYDLNPILKRLEKTSTKPVTIHDLQAEINNLKREIRKQKSNQINYLKEEISFKSIQQQLDQTHIQNKIKDLLLKIQNSVCSDIPHAFWNRKQHIVNLPYERDFKENQFPTKARPIQMNEQLLHYCQKEIKDLLSKNLIRPSKSPWSCAAFYVNKQAELERGTPRLVINYKPLNQALRWIRYPIPNKKDLLNPFNIPFGQYEWNVMPFGLKNAPSEFQKIMNDIFNPYTSFAIVYIDDVLIFSQSIDQHFKHVNIFVKIITQNGFAV
uniref:Polyprotein n=1 Tax=Cajanus cajan TaxID=3821 RepID=A0A151RKI6_CAJCA|nr:polyprotein [Cajanus cajan]